MSTLNSSLSTISSNQNNHLLSNILQSQNNYLQKKRKRVKFMDSHHKHKYKQRKKHKYKNYCLSSSLPIDKMRRSKSIIHPEKRGKQIQSTLNDFFKKPTFDDIDKRDSMIGSHKLNTYDENSSLTIFDDYPRYNKNKMKNKLEDIPPKMNNNKEKYDNENKSNDIFNFNHSDSNIDKQNQRNPFSEFSNIIKKSKEENVVKKDNYNYLIINNIFDKSEINLAMSIEKEFNQEINELNSDTDKLIKTTMFFINKGFNEYIRYNIYKCLINYGLPLVDNFNNFYEKFITNCSNEKMNIPDKVYIEFYIEYITNILIKDKISTAKNKLISEFFFNGENMNIIKNNFNSILHFKENKNNARIYILNYLGINYDKLFNEMNIKIDKSLPKSKNIICRMLSNIVLECNKIGYLNYKKIIINDDILFDGLKIKGNEDMEINYRKMIPSKLFGQYLSEKKFNNVMMDYFLQLLSSFKI